MFVFLCILTLFVFLVLVVVAAMRPESPGMSQYELRRRAEVGDRSAETALSRQHLRVDIESILRVKVAFLLVLTAFLLVVTFGWVIGSLGSLMLVLSYGAIARLERIRRLGQYFYQLLEPKLFTLTQNASGFISIIRSGTPPADPVMVSSRQELQHLVDQSEGVLSPDEKKLVVHSLAFSDKIVHDIMTPVDQIAHIKKSEFLGPLTLDELHKSGHSRLPVMSQDIDHLVGILHLQSLLTLDIKRSVTAEKAMDPHVHYVRHDQTLPHALAGMLRSHQHLFIVINTSRETVGLVTLEDIIEALIGHTIIDEFDSHESARAVAAHEPHTKS